MRDDVNEKATDDASLLVILLDLNIVAVDAGSRGASQTLGFKWLFEQVVVFINAFLLLHPSNRIACIALYAGKCHFLYEGCASSSSVIGKESEQQNEPDTGPVGVVLLQKFQQMVSETDATQPEQQAPMLSGALSMALCYIHRIVRAMNTAGAARLSPRILTLYASKDPASQYIPVMNALFSAQRSGVPLDTCVVGKDCDSPFLQQAAHLTGGVLLRAAHPSALLQYLLSVFAVDRFTRQFIRMPEGAAVDFRASCFCHKRTISLGHVCSVCLSIFCQECKECSTCGTVFAAPKAPGGKRKRPAEAA